MWSSYNRYIPELRLQLFSLGDLDFLTVGKRVSAYVDLLVCGVLPKSTSVGMSIPYLLDWMKCVGLLVSVCVCVSVCVSVVPHSMPNTTSIDAVLQQQCLKWKSRTDDHQYSPEPSARPGPLHSHIPKSPIHTL